MNITMNDWRDIEVAIRSKLDSLKCTAQSVQDANESRTVKRRMRRYKGILSKVQQIKESAK